MALAVGEALSPNKPNLDMTLAFAEVLSNVKILSVMHARSVYSAARPMRKHL